MTLEKTIADDVQRISISNSFMRFTTSSLLSMGKQMLPRAILWFFLMIATAIGGWFAW